MARVLDFGSDGNLMPGFDSINAVDEDGHVQKEIDGTYTMDVWVKPGVEIPAGKGVYQLVNCRYALTHNPMDHWDHILREFKRVLAPGGVIAIVESNGIDQMEDPRFDLEYIHGFFDRIFPPGEYLVMFKGGQDDGDLWFNVMVMHRYE